MTTEKTWLARYIDERMFEYEERIRLRELKGRPGRPGLFAWVPNGRATARSAPDFASYGDSHAEQEHGRDILVSARASVVAAVVQTMAAPAQGREPLRVASGLLRRSGDGGRRGFKMQRRCLGRTSVLAPTAVEVGAAGEVRLRAMN